jgi:hypothetical protein
MTTTTGAQHRDALRTAVPAERSVRQSTPEKELLEEETLGKVDMNKSRDTEQ